ncbi:MAG: OadG family transporter subunit [bacterium]|jgi:sodium pump decarboxylase gamma subunit
MDKLVLGMQTTLLGMGVVFVALFVLAKVTEALRLLTRPGGAKAAAEPAAADAAESPAPAGETTAPEELVAVIAAALASYLNRPADSFRILAVSPAEPAAGIPTSAWKTAGRLKLMESRLAAYSRERKFRR